MGKWHSRWALLAGTVGASRQQLMWGIAVLLVLILSLQPTAVLFGLEQNAYAASTETVKFKIILEKLTSNLKIVNRSGAQVRLSLSGAKPYTFAVPTGQTKAEVIKGKNTYSYLDHGVYESGEINIQSEQATLTLPNQIASLKIANQSGADVQVSLQGKLPYFLSAATGTSKHEIQRGSYQYKYYACGKWQSRELQVNKNTVDLKIASCQSASSGEVKVVIVNDTPGLLRLHLTGPGEYWFSFSPGTETVFVAKGKYDYTAWGCGGASTSGTRNISSKLKWRFWCK